MLMRLRSNVALTKTTLHKYIEAGLAYSLIFLFQIIR